MDIAKIIKKVKPEISDSTLKAYVQNITKLHKMINGNAEIESLDFLKNIDEVLKKLNDKMVHTKKNYLSAIVVALLSDDKKYEKVIHDYREKVKELKNKVMDNYEDNEKSEKKKKNWVDYPDVLKLLKRLKKEASGLLNKQNLTTKEKDMIQQYLVLYLYSGKDFPVPRNDFADMKVIKKGEQMDKDKNYFVVKKGAPYFKLNEFKTSKYKGEQNIPVADMELRRLINKWVKINGTGFLLINNSNNTPMTANGISKYLQKIFKKYLNKDISSSLLRSIYTTHIYKNNDLSQKDKKELAEGMMNSKNTAELVYNKVK